MAITMFGIPNCDTVRKARRWLDERDIAYVFHDYKKQGVDAALLRQWVEAHGWQKILNRAGTTFRKLPDGDKADIDSDKAVALMQAHNSLIKRPVVVHGKDVLVGFDPETYASALG